MKLKVFIVEDDQCMVDILKNILSQMPAVEVIGHSSNCEEANEKIFLLKPNIVFLDIYLPGNGVLKNGLDIARNISLYNSSQSIEKSIFMVFATGFDDFYKYAFKYYVFDYITKPFRLERVQLTVDIIRKIFESIDKGDEQIVLNEWGELIVLNQDDIYYITKEGKYTQIRTLTDRYYTKQALESISEQLVSIFIRCHKGYIVNTQKILEIRRAGIKTYRILFKDIDDYVYATRIGVKSILKRFNGN